MKIYCSILELKEHFKKRWGAIFTDNSTVRWIKEEMYLLKRGLQDHLALKNQSKKRKSLILQQKIFWKKQVKASCLKCKYQRHSWHIWKVIMFINKKILIWILFFNIHFCQNHNFLYIQYVKVRSCQLFLYLKERNDSSPYNIITNGITGITSSLK